MQLDQKEILARRVKLERLARGISQIELAEEVGVGRSLIASIERGDSNTSMETLEALAKLFHCTISNLFSIEGVPEDELPLEMRTETERKKFAQNLKTILKRKGMSASQLAYKSEITINTVYSYMSAARAPSTQNFNKIAKALGLEPTDLLRNLEPRKDEPLPQIMIDESGPNYLPMLQSIEAKLGIIENKVNLVDERVMKGFGALENTIKQFFSKKSGRSKIT